MESMGHRVGQEQRRNNAGPEGVMKWRRMWKREVSAGTGAENLDTVGYYRMDTSTW